MSMTDHSQTFEQYHVLSCGRGWRFTREGRKTALCAGDKQKVMKEAIYTVSEIGGMLYVHNPDGTIDWHISWS